MLSVINNFVTAQVYSRHRTDADVQNKNNSLADNITTRLKLLSVISNIFFKVIYFKTLSILGKKCLKEIEMNEHIKEHKFYDILTMNIRRVLGNKLLIPSRNVLKIKYWSRLHEFPKEGFCKGACINFAELLIPHLKNEEADVMVEKIAKKYELGMGKKDAEAQSLSNDTIGLSLGLSPTVLIKKSLKILKESGEITALEKKMIQKFIFWLNYPTNTKIKDFINSHPEFNYLQDTLKAIEPIIRSPINPKIIRKLIKENSEMQPNIKYWISAYIKKLCTTRWDWNKKSTKPLLKKIIFGICPRLRKQKISKLYQNSLDEILTQIVFNMKNKAVMIEEKKLKLKYTSEQLGIFCLKSDPAYLSRLGNLDIGCYMFSFNTKAEDNNHVTLYINLKDKKYYWDPNFGLFSLSKNNPQKTILKVMSLYKARGSNNSNNHAICIYTIDPV